MCNGQNNEVEKSMRVDRHFWRRSRKRLRLLNMWNRWCVVKFQWIIAVLCWKWNGSWLVPYFRLRLRWWDVQRSSWLWLWRKRKCSTLHFQRMNVWTCLLACLLASPHIHHIYIEEGEILCYPSHYGGASDLSHKKINNEPKSLIFSMTFFHEHISTYNNSKHTQIILISW